MSKLGKKISMEILNKYNGGWIKFYEFNNLTLIAGVELNHIKYDGSKVNYIMEIVIYNNVTKKIIYCTGNNLRITDESDVYMNLDELLMFIYYTYDQEKGRFMAGAENIINGFIYDFNTIKFNIKYLSEIALTLKEENELYKNILNN